MAEWIKIDKALTDKPEVFQISEILGIDEFAVAGRLLRFWSWWDSHSHDGRHAPSVTKVRFDRDAGRDGWCDALIEVGWLIEDENGLSIPNFDRHLGSSAKKRAQSAKRSRTYRDEPSRTKRDAKSDGSVTNSVTREEEIREEERRSIKKESKPKKRFIPPSVDEVAAYVRERAALGRPHVDAGRFVDHYTANGWKVGKNSMKDWKAAVRTWERSSVEQPRYQNGSHAGKYENVGIEA